MKLEQKCRFHLVLMIAFSVEKLRFMASFKRQRQRGKILINKHYFILKGFSHAPRIFSTAWSGQIEICRTIRLKIKRGFEQNNSQLLNSTWSPKRRNLQSPDFVEDLIWPHYNFHRWKIFSLQVVGWNFLPKETLLTVFKSPDNTTDKRTNFNLNAANRPNFQTDNCWYFKTTMETSVV